jgi:phenylacetate-CoA ligase
MAGIAERIYKRAPIALQHVMVSAYGWHWRRMRFGGAFEAEYRGFRERERFSREQWNAYVEHQLRGLLMQAFARVPHYQRAWKGVVSPEQLERFKVSDLSALPPLEKSIVRDDPQSLLLDGKPASGHRVFHTSGSTGTPIATYWLPHEIQRSLALREARACAFAGVSYRMPRATFSGRLVEPNVESKGPFHRCNLSERQVYFSAFHLRPETAPLYVDALRRYQVRWLTGYSSSIFQLAQMALEQGLNAPPLKAVITTSEKVTPEMRTVIERAFASKLFEEYGAVEDAFFVSENEQHRKLVSPDAGVLEVVDDALRACAPGVEGEVLATGFIRPSQPLIRYRIGDRASYDNSPTDDGRHMPVLREVIGRAEDTVYGTDGRRLVRFHGLFVDQPNIREGQVIQKSLDHIHIKIVTKPDFDQANERDLVSRLQERLSREMRVTVEQVQAIERTKAGKFRAVVSELSAEELRRVKARPA